MMMGMMHRDFGLNGPSYEAASQDAEHRKWDNVRVLQAAEGAVNSAGPALTCDISFHWPNQLCTLPPSVPPC